MTRLALTALLIVAVLAAPVAADGTITLDDQHPLDSEAYIAEYQRSGNVSYTFDRVALTVTIADTHDGVGLDGFQIDAGTVYVRLDYDEELARTIRVHIPAAYFTPRTNTAKEAVEGGPPVAVAPTANRSATALTIEVAGRTDAVYAFGTVEGRTSQGRSLVRRAISNVTGFQLPSLATGVTWQYLDGRALAANETVRIPREQARQLTMQYNPAGGDETWLRVPQCDEPTDQAVCRYRVKNATVVLSTQAEPPTVRYRRGTDPSALGASLWDSVGATLDNIGDFLGGLFG